MGAIKWAFPVLDDELTEGLPWEVAEAEEEEAAPGRRGGGLREAPCESARWTEEDRREVAMEFAFSRSAPES